MSLRLRLELSSTGGSTTGLPSDLLTETSRRLAMAMIIIGGVYVVYLFLYLVPFREAGFALGRWTGAVCAVVSFAAATYLRRTPDCPYNKVEVIGVGYEIAIAFSIAIVEYWRLDLFDYKAPLTTVSWTCVLIVIFPFLVPLSARKAVLSALAAATANPFAFVLAMAFTDQPALPGPVIASLLVPPYICAAMSVAPARVLNMLGKAVTRARRLGSYELVERLGQGGMGEVWRAKHRLLVRPAAVKLIRPDVLGARGEGEAAVLRERFEREAQVTASLQSPHTVTLYDFGVSPDGVFYYVMEYLEGIDLDALVTQYGPLPPGRVVHLLKQACDSLGEAHEAGLIHRDIKPANMVVGRRGRQMDFLSVLDFGLVKPDATMSHDLTKLTAEDVIQGTPAFLSPEAVTGDQPVGPHSDIYAIGCVAYWLLAGREVFEESSPMNMAIAHATKTPTAPSSLSEQPIPESVDSLVMRCLSKVPDDRPASADELLDLLNACNDVASWSNDEAHAWWRIHAPQVPSA